MNSRKEKINEISTRVLLEIIFEEKKNFNSKEKKDADMIKQIKSIIEREVRKNDLQKNDNQELSSI